MLQSRFFSNRYDRYVNSMASSPEIYISGGKTTSTGCIAGKSPMSSAKIPYEFPFHGLWDGKLRKGSSNWPFFLGNIRIPQWLARSAHPCVLEEVQHPTPEIDWSHGPWALAPVGRCGSCHEWQLFSQLSKWFWSKWFSSQSRKKKLVEATNQEVGYFEWTPF